MELDETQESLSIKAWEPGQPMIQTLAGSRPKQSQCFTSSPRAGEKTEVPAQPARQEEVPLPHWSISFIVLFWPSTDWIRPLT